VTTRERVWAQHALLRVALLTYLPLSRVGLSFAEHGKQTDRTILIFGAAECR
jgi:hypothetical protein